MSNSAFILTLAYPDTIVSHAKEWYSPYLRFVGVGNKTSVRAGHAALVLINRDTEILEYHDFGRYITSEPNGRVRGMHTDNELQFPFKAKIKDNKILNLERILKFLATHPKITHGDGRLVASVCNKINYDLARTHISKMQAREFIKIKKDKGFYRPFNNLKDRVILLDSIKYIDQVKTFNSKEILENLIKNLTPDIIVVGSDWKGKEIVGGSYTKKIVYFDRIKNYSTTNILEWKNCRK